MKKLSENKFDLYKSRRLVSLKAIDPLKNTYKTIDIKVDNKGYNIPVRMYFPKHSNNPPILLFFHGGGFVTESIRTYNRICRNLSKNTSSIVVSVDYRLAPEYKFPIGLEDCYCVARKLYYNQILENIDTSRITIIGDSAGGNFAAALSLMARDRNEFKINKQVLIYPCTDNDYSSNSKYPSVIENGEDYLLTRSDLNNYMDLYLSCEKDRENPYFSPIKAKNFENLPDTLLITAQYDPLRDEGELFGRKMLEANNRVEIHRIENAIHGFFAYTTKTPYTKRCLKYINDFLIIK